MRTLHFVDKNDLPQKNVFGRDLAPGDYRRYLGQTLQSLYWDASRGLYPNAFAALAATLADNCRLYLHLPKDYPQGDPDHRRLTDYANPLTDCRCYFNQRLYRIAQSAIYTPNSIKTEDDSCIHRHSPQIYLGKRGRGKTTRLADKIRWLEKQFPDCPILIVTPYRSNLYRLQQLLPPAENHIFLPPDDALNRKPPAVHLIIDEASAIAPKQLLRLTEHYPAYTLAATEDGYEGTAHEFSRHTLPTLLAHIPSPEVIYHRYAKRYAQDDILENIIENAFLLQAHTLPPAMPNTIRCISRDELASHEGLLRNIYALLCQAHYRTTPEDLKRLLDLPFQTLIIAEKAGEVAGVAHILHETALSPALSAEVIRGNRRPQGRLLLQQLLHKTQDRMYNRPLNRISRIAVCQSQRRKGIAAALIRYAQSILPDPLGVIYGHCDELAAFWQALDFAEIYRMPTNNKKNRPTSIRIKLT